MANQKPNDLIQKIVAALSLASSIGVVILGITVYRTTPANTPLNSSENLNIKLNEFEHVFRTQVAKDPKYIYEAVQKYIADQRSVVSKAPVSTDLAEQMSSGFPWIGPAEPEFTLVEFIDLRCAYCQIMHSQIRDLHSKNPTMRIVHQHLPILGPDSDRLARQSIAIWKLYPERYEDFQNYIMSNKGPLPDEILNAQYQAEKMNINAIHKLAASDEVSATINRTTELAKQASVVGTPAFFVGTRAYRGSANIDEFERWLTTR